MRRVWIAAAVAALAMAGCHRKAVVADAQEPQFSPTYAAGSTGDQMAHLAMQYGVPVYPNSVPDTSHFNSSDAAQGRIYLAYTTSDPSQKVVSFYQGQLHVQVTTNNAVTQLIGSSQNGSPITLNIGHDPNGSRTDYSIQITSLPTQSASSTLAQDAAVGSAVATQNAPSPANQDTTQDQSANQNQQTYEFNTSNAPQDVNNDQNGNSTDQSQNQQPDNSVDNGNNSDNSNADSNNDSNNGQDSGNQDQNQNPPDNGGGDDSQDPHGPPGPPGQ